MHKKHQRVCVSFQKQKGGREGVSLSLLPLCHRDWLGEWCDLRSQDLHFTLSWNPQLFLLVGGGGGRGAQRADQGLKSVKEPYFTRAIKSIHFQMHQGRR